MNVQSRLEWPQPFAASVTTQRLRFDVEPDLPVSVLNFDIRNAPEGRPSLTCRIEPAINPHVEQAERHTWKWAVAAGLVDAVDDGHKYKRFVSARFPWLAARSYPTVDASQLELISDWITFLFFYDDMCDTQAATDPAYLQKLVAREDRLVALAFGAELCETDSPLDRALADILARVAARANSFWQQRLATHIQEYIEGCRWERIIRAQGQIPRLATYSRLRLLISAVFPCFDFAGICIDGQRSDFARSIHVQQLEVMANNYICWVNDIYGLDKEIGEKTTSNLVIVLANQHRLTWDQAIDQAIEMCNAELEAFVELELQLEQLGDPDCQAYVRALEAWMRGNLDWYSETHRYQGGERPTEQVGEQAGWSAWTSWQQGATG